MSQQSNFDLLKFIVPCVLGAMIEPLAGVIDTAFVGRINTNWLAALAIAGTIISVFSWLLNFLIHTVTPNVSSLQAKNRFAEIVEVIKTSFYFSLVLSILFCGFIYLGKDLLFEFFGVDPKIQKEVWDYLFIRSIGIFSIIFLQSLLGVLRGLKLVNEAFSVQIIVTIINIVLNYIFLFILDKNLVWVGMATNLSFFIGLIFCFRIFYRHQELNFKIKKLMSFPTKEMSLRIGGDSWFHFGRTFLLSSNFLITTAIVSRLGILSLAAHQVVLQNWLLLSFLVDGFAVAISIIVSEKKEHNDLDYIAKIVAQLMNYCLLIGSWFGIMYYIFDDHLISIYTKDKEVLGIILTIWPIICIVQPLNAVTFFYDGVLFGFREFKYLRNVMMIAIFAVAFPLYWYSYKMNSIIYLWYGLIGVSVVRLIGSHLRYLKIIARS